MASETTETVTLDADGEVRIPTIELLTGRGFVTGKSGGGKSNTASVVAEELLDDGHPLMIVDTDGEYYGLKERYEVLHAGGDDECDVQVGTEHADKLAELALDGGVPVILDVSAYLDDGGHDIVRATVEALFRREQEARRPFLLLVEEVHEFIPESGGLTEAGKMLVRVAKRGRKRGLGFCGISQRPANVKKDVITQCDWLCWHRLTWNNDTAVVGRVLDNQAAEAVQNLADGEAILVTDWDGTRRRVQVRRKRTFDAGSTPGLGDVDRPELKSIGEGLLGDLTEISDQKREHENRLAKLEADLERKNERIAELERELAQARDLSEMAQQFTRALTGDGVPSASRRPGSDDGPTHHELGDFEANDEASNGGSTDTASSDTTADDTAPGDKTDDTTTTADIAGTVDADNALDTDDGSEVPATDETADGPASETGEADPIRVADDPGGPGGSDPDPADEPSSADLLDMDIVRHEIARTEDHSRASPAYAKGIVATLIDAGGPVSQRTLLDRLGASSTDEITTVATTLESMRTVRKEHTDEGLMVEVDPAGVRELRETSLGRERTRSLADGF
ncbi:helicase HerA domain-containing protein [Halococcus sp. IIIV-5B]|uniref:helicase HerA domain-containing protein n=1 Tax=Halococcus sp. IIIV-5B TaxID=2321230 RepID=UPI000E73D143|nr:DUF87 domain-containing protein [Halococcus sp. IIIV-5B]RJT05233.1 DUF87 domain-containing protein [Halococcus sp. IIIV-5B]